MLHTVDNIIKVPFLNLHKVRFNYIKAAYLNQKEFICMMSHHHAIWAPPLFRVYTVTSTASNRPYLYCTIIPLTTDKSTKVNGSHFFCDLVIT